MGATDLRKYCGGKINITGFTNRGRVFYAALVLFGLYIIFSASSEYVSNQREYSAARAEYEQLREQYPAVASLIDEARQARLADEAGLPSMQGSGFSPELKSDTRSNPYFDPRYISRSDIGSATRTGAHPGPGVSPAFALNDAPQVSDMAEDGTMAEDGAQAQDGAAAWGGTEARDTIAELADINPDFVGWISIEGVIDYPVARGKDNEHYLYTTFSGQRNASGAVFMDCRNNGGFDNSVCILYGHNMRDGSMFAPLKKYLSSSFLVDNPNINIVTPKGEFLTYRILAATKTDTWDRAYEFDFSNPPAEAGAIKNAQSGPDRFLLLSTCTDSADRNDRLLIYAQLVA